MIDAESALLRRMIAESGQMWLEVRDRSQLMSGVVICTRPGRAFYLERAKNYEATAEFQDGWVVIEQALEMADAEHFFAEFGHHWPYWIGAIVGGLPIRAYIKNGRHEGWSISQGASE